MHNKLKSLLVTSTAMYAIMIEPSLAGSCTAVSPGVYSCSGPASAPAGSDASQALSSAGALSVTTTTDFGINSNAGLAFNLSSAGPGGLVFNGTGSAPIIGSTVGIGAGVRDTGDTLSITAAGPVSGGTYGILANNFGTDGIAVRVGDAAGGNTGILSTNYFAGALLITSTGRAMGDSGLGIDAFNSGTNLSVEAHDVTGKQGGIFALNNGTGWASITATGPVIGTDGYGISAANGSISTPAGTDLTIQVMDASGKTTGIYARNNGSGATSITASGLVMGQTGNGVDVSNSRTTTDLTVSVKDISGGTNGIVASNGGTGSTSVKATGQVTGADGDGIYAVDNGKGLAVEANLVSGSKMGIHADNFGTGSTTITASGEVKGATTNGIQGINYANARNLTIQATDVAGIEHGIYAENRGLGFTTVTATGLVTGTLYDGIHVLNRSISNATGLVVNAQDVSGAQDGIVATNNGGGGPTSVTATGKVVGTTGSGISVWNSSARAATDMSIEAKDVSGAVDGINAFNIGSGVTRITTTGLVEGGSRDGIQATNGRNGTDLTIQSNDVFGGTSGISAYNSGKGVLSIEATDQITGRSAYGIVAYNNEWGTDLTIAANNVAGGTSGIKATNYSPGALSVMATGQVNGVASYGIEANNWYGTDLTIRANDATGGQDGIYAVNRGTGSTLITTTGQVTGTTGNGIEVQTYGGTDLTIAANNASGALNGISAGGSGSGAFSITATGLVSGGQYNGINAWDYGGTDLTIRANNVTGGQDGISAVHSGSGVASIAVTGAVSGGEYGILLHDSTTTSGADNAIAVGSGGVVQGGGAGIAVVSDTNVRATSIVNNGVVRNQSGLSSDLAVLGRYIDPAATPAIPARLAITNNGLITGTVALGELGNSFVNNAGATWNTAGGSNDFGALTTGNSLVNAGTVIAATGGATDPVQTTTFGNVGTFSNAGVLTMQNGRAGDTSVVGGTYISNGGKLLIDTVLEADQSVTDKLITDRIALGSGGATGIYVANAGGLGALTTGNGIELVHVNGGAAESAPGAFALGNRVAAGAYEYNLYRNGTAGADGNWYLRSFLTPSPEPEPEPGPGPTPGPQLPSYRAEVAVDMVTPALASRFGLSMLGTCDARMAGMTSGTKPASCGDERTGNAMWGRLFGQTGNIGFGGGDLAGRIGQFERHGPTYDFSLGGLQVGADLWANEDDRGSRNVAGFYFGAGSIDSTVDLAQGGRAGKTSMNGYSLGAYFTHKDAQGWYLDAVAQGTRYANIRASSDGPAGQTLKTNGWGFVTSLEGGYPVTLGNGWSVVPQAQLVYQHLWLGGGSDAFGTIRYDDSDALYGRIGGKLNKDWTTQRGQVFTTWASANLWHSFGAQAKTTFNSFDGLNPVALKADLGGTWAQLGVGVSGQITANTSVFAAADYSFGVDASKGHSIGGRVGIRTSW